jgi:hypothetical protein
MSFVVFFFFLSHPSFRNQTDEPKATHAFESKHIDQMFQHKYELREEVRHLFITIDPSAGKDANLYVLCSTVFTRDGVCLVCHPLSFRV